jgi:hypothetical protein
MGIMTVFSCYPVKVEAVAECRSQSAARGSVGPTGGSAYRKVQTVLDEVGGGIRP